MPSTSLYTFFSSYVWYSSIKIFSYKNLFKFIGFVYPFLAHWMWGASGWLGAVVGARVRNI
jgi:hypothetical protein